MLAKAKAMRSKLGEPIPAGIAEGTPAFDEWVQAWYQGGVNSGDPRFVMDAGGSVAEGGGAEDVIAGGWENAAPASEWLGKRNPTPGELRRYAKESGQSEDYARFSDRQLAQWIQTGWKGDHFENDFGDRVEKPTESGPKSKAAGYATGEKSVGSGGGGGTGKGGAAKGGNLGEWAADNSVNPELQQQLLSIFEQGGGYFDPAQRAGVSLQGGGMVWRDPEQQAAPTASTTTPTSTDASRTIAVTPRTDASSTQPGDFMTNAVNPALAAATLNAFSPQAPSKQVAGGSVSQPQSFMPTTPQPSTPGMPALAVQPAATTVAAPSPTTGTSPLTGALSQKFAKQNQWWMNGGKQNYTV